MTQDEVGILLERHAKEKLEQWEKTRLMMYAPIAANSTKPIKPADIFPLPTDSKGHDKEKKHKESPEEARARIMKRLGRGDETKTI